MVDESKDDLEYISQNMANDNKKVQKSQRMLLKRDLHKTVTCIVNTVVKSNNALFL